MNLFFLMCALYQKPWDCINNAVSICSDPSDPLMCALYQKPLDCINNAVSICSDPSDHTDLGSDIRLNPGKNEGGDIDFAVFHVSRRKSESRALSSAWRNDRRVKIGSHPTFFRRSSGCENGSCAWKAPAHSNTKNICAQSDFTALANGF